MGGTLDAVGGSYLADRMINFALWSLSKACEKAHKDLGLLRKVGNEHRNAAPYPLGEFVDYMRDSLVGYGVGKVVRGERHPFHVNWPHEDGLAAAIWPDFQRGSRPLSPPRHDANLVDCGPIEEDALIDEIRWLHKKPP